MFGGTPSNLAISVMQNRKVEVIAGVNLPMLLRALNYRHEPLEVMVQRALAGGATGVMAIDAPQAP